MDLKFIGNRPYEAIEAILVENGSNLHLGYAKFLEVMMESFP